MKTLILAMTISLFGVSGFSDDHGKGKVDHSKMDHSKMDHKKGEKHEHKDSTASFESIGKGKVIVKVKGMVCDFCAQGIEKNFGKRSEVESTNVDLDKMTVEINFKKGKTLDKKTVASIIEDAGFKFVGVADE